MSPDAAEAEVDHRERRKNDPADALKLALLARADARLLALVEYRTAEQQAELVGTAGRWRSARDSDYCLPALLKR
jgi:hypothetical protein